MPVGANQAVLGIPGLRSVSTAEYRRVFQSASPLYVPGGRFINGLVARDVGNTPFTDALRAGLVMGLRPSDNLYANSIIDLSTLALAEGGTTITLSTAGATELVRRIGAAGNLTLTGGSAASGVARQLTVAYSAVNTGNGQVTITSPTVNQVDQISLNAASTGGNLALRIQKPDGTFATTGNAAWSATDATYLANIQTVLDAASGVAGGIVASAIPATDTDNGIRLTYAGGAYAGKAWVSAAVAVFPTSSTIAFYQNVTPPVSGAFIAGSFVGDTDGSQVPRSLLPDGPAVPVATTQATGGVSPIQFPQVPQAALVDVAYVVNYPTDTGLQAWLKQQLLLNGQTQFMFSDGL